MSQMISLFQDNANKLALRANIHVFVLFNGCREFIDYELKIDMGVGSNGKTFGAIAYGFACDQGGKTKQHPDE